MKPAKPTKPTKERTPLDEAIDIANGVATSARAIEIRCQRARETLEQHRERLAALAEAGEDVVFAVLEAALTLGLASATAAVMGSGSR